jgi:protein SCO1/2
MAAGTLLPQPRPIPEFDLVSDDGQPFTRTALQDHWTVVFVGFTHCPDICPNTLGQLKTVYTELEKRDKPLQVLLLSVDPERDRPETLARYVDFFHPSFRAVTGPVAELDRLGAAMGFVYMKSPGSTPESYTIDHSSALILVNPQGQVAGYFTQPLDVDALVADLGKLLPDAAG